MRNQFIQFFTLVLFLCAPIIALASYVRDCCDGWKIEGEFLWWKPCITDLEFAARVSNPNFFGLLDLEPGEENNATTKSVCPGWEPGVRVRLSTPSLWCHWRARAEYTFIQSNASDSLAGDNIALLTLEPFYLFDDNSGEAKASWRADYHEWNLLISNDIFCSCHRFTPFFGASGIFLKQDLKNKYFDSPVNQPYVLGSGDRTKWHSDYWGIGIRIGAEYQYQFSNCISLFVEANGDLLAGQACSKHKEFIAIGEPPASFTIKNDVDCLMVDGYHFKGGLLYEACICQCQCLFKLGYEFLKWHNLPNDPKYFGTAVSATENTSLSTYYHATSSTIRTFGFNGLFLGLAVEF